MESAIIKLLYTDSGRYEEAIKSEEYRKYNLKLCEAYDKLIKLLTEEGKKLLNEIDDASTGMEGEASETYFKEGVRVGARIMLDILSDE